MANANFATSSSFSTDAVWAEALKPKPAISATTAITTTIQKNGFLKISLFLLTPSSLAWFIKSTAKTGFITNATTNEAAKVKMSMVGKYTMNLPIMPGQNNSGKKGANVVNVPAKTGTKTSPAAIRADKADVILPLLSTNIRWVFSITTMASSTIMPNPNNKANNTIKLRVTCVPTIKSAPGKNINATNILSGTDKATKKAFVTPIKNIKIINTNTKPIMIELTKSLNEVRVLILKSPVITAFKSVGYITPRLSSTIFFTPSLVSIKFSPLRLIMLSVTTFLPFNRA